MKKQIPTVSINFDNLNCTSDKKIELKNIELKISGLRNPYIGNKKKLIQFIVENLDKHNVNYTNICDLFAGSSYVSLAFKELNSNVISNELMNWAYLISLAYIENNEFLATKKKWEELCFSNNNENKEIIVVKDDFFINSFNDNELKTIENYRKNVEQISDKYEYATMMSLMNCYILDHCFVGGRLYKNQCITKYDHRINHVRNNGHYMRFNDVHICNFINNNTLCKSYNYDVFDFVDKTTINEDTLIYIDPPYGSQQSDYLRMFRWNEEFVLNKKIESLPYFNNSKKFINTKTYMDNFLELLYKLSKFKTLVISYNEKSWASIDEIGKIIKDSGRSIIVEELKYRYRHRKINDCIGKEYLIIVRT